VDLFPVEFEGIPTSEESVTGRALHVFVGVVHSADVFVESCVVFKFFLAKRTVVAFRVYFTFKGFLASVLSEIE